MKGPTYIAPRLRPIALQPSELLAPSAHNEVGDDGELTRRQEWFEEDEEEVQNTFNQKSTFL